MPVHYISPTAQSLFPVPGITLGTAAAKIKRWDRDDVVLVVAEPGAIAAGVFTQNRFCAAPVIVSREHLASQRARGVDFRALVINAGNAYAGTGDAGMAASRATCIATARLVDCAPEQALVYSTGVIMEPLPVARIVDALPSAHEAAHADNWLAAARAIMTTDTVPKGASRRI
jgi:glutamate N-acetyltransferase/amino-acid N-acetyltransferase